MNLLSSGDFSFSKLTFLSNYSLTTKVTKGLDPDHDQSSVGPDLGAKHY